MCTVVYYRGILNRFLHCHEDINDWQQVALLEHLPKHGDKRLCRIYLPKIGYPSDYVYYSGK